MTDPVSFWPADFAGWTEAVRNAGLVLAGAAGFGVALWALLLNRRRTTNDTRRTVNDTYVKAIEQLGHAKMEVRLGAIYALERIAATDRDYHWPIMETLCAYIRERPASKWGEKPEKEAGADGELAAARTTADISPAGDFVDSEGVKPALRGPPVDIQAILTVFGRRSQARKDSELSKKLWLGLRYMDFSEAFLPDIRLERAELYGANLRFAYLENAILTDALLAHAKLTKASLMGVKLTNASLRNAHMEGANLMDVDLSSANLAGSDLRRVILSGAVLKGANIKGAVLIDADLKGADLEGAILTDANLMGAKFSRHPSEMGARWDEAEPPKHLDKIKIEGS